MNLQVHLLGRASLYTAPYERTSMSRAGQLVLTVDSTGFSKLQPLSNKAIVGVDVDLA